MLSNHHVVKKQMVEYFINIVEMFYGRMGFLVEAKIMSSLSITLSNNPGLSVIDIIIYHYLNY